MKKIHWQCDVRSSFWSHFLFFEMSRIGEQNYIERSSFVMWCSIMWSIWLALPRNEQNWWTQLSWKIVIFHVMFDHVINLACSSSKWTELVDATILRNRHFSCDVRSSFWSHFLSFEMSRIGEQNYAERSSFVVRFSIMWSIWLALPRNEQNRWTELLWKIFIGNVMFDHLFDLTFCSSKRAE